MKLLTCIFYEYSNFTSLHLQTVQRQLNGRLKKKKKTALTVKRVKRIRRVHNSLVW